MRNRFATETLSRRDNCLNPGICLAGSPWQSRSAWACWRYGTTCKCQLMHGGGGYIRCAVVFGVCMVMGVGVSACVCVCVCVCE